MSELVISDFGKYRAMRGDLRGVNKLLTNDRHGLSPLAGVGQRHRHKGEGASASMVASVAVQTLDIEHRTTPADAIMKELHELEFLFSNNGVYNVIKVTEDLTLASKVEVVLGSRDCPISFPGSVVTLC